MSLSAQIFAKIHGVLSGPADFGTPTFELSTGDVVAHSLQSGIAAGQADKLFADQRTLAASATENLDLAGSLLDPLGAIVTFVSVKAIMIRASAANTNNVVVGGAASNAFAGPLGGTAPTLTVPPGGIVLLTAPKTGWPVVASTGDLLKVANGGAGTPVTYDVIVIGTSA